MKKAKRKVLKGKNKFIRLDDDNLKFVVKIAKENKRSQNWVINQALHEARISFNASNRE